MKTKIVFTLLLLSICVSASAFKVQDACNVRAEGLAVAADGNVWMSLREEFSDGDKALSLACYSSGKWKEDIVSISYDGRLAAGALWVSPLGELCLFYSEDEVCKVRICSEPAVDQFLWAEPIIIGKGVPTAPPVLTLSGVTVLPASLPSGEVKLFISKDKCATWTEIDVPAGELSSPRLFIDKKGRIVMVLRSCGTARCYSLISSDGGKTWDGPKPFAWNPDRDFALCSLGGGKTLMVKNCRYDNAMYHLASGLYAYITPDDGRTWYGGLKIASEYGYVNPLVAVDGCGNVYVACNKDDNEVKFAIVSESEISKAWGDNSAVALNSSVPFVSGKDRRNVEKRVWADSNLRVATYNITPWKNTVKNELAHWEKRRESVRLMVQENAFDLLCTQGVDEKMLGDILENLGDEYACISSDAAISLNPIFYKKNHISLQESGVLWFSDKEGTIGLDATAPRSATWARFKDPITGMEFYCFNSQFDEVGMEARIYSGEMLIDAIRQQCGTLPVVLTGGFANDEDAPGYKYLATSGIVSDSAEAIPLKKRDGWEYPSLTRFRPIEKIEKSAQHLDHIFYTPATSKITAWKQITTSYGGIFGSDHLPVCIEWKISK